MAAIQARVLAGLVATRLVGVTNATGYYGQIDARNGLPGVTGTPADPPPKSSTDARVQPYFILFPGIGTPGPETSVGGHTDSFVDRDSLLRITAAAGDIDDLLALVDRINDLLWRWSPGPITAEGGPTVLCGPLLIPPGYDPQPLQDATFTPVRHYVQLQFQLTAHT